MARIKEFDQEIIHRSPVICEDGRPVKGKRMTGHPDEVTCPECLDILEDRNTEETEEE